MHPPPRRHRRRLSLRCRAVVPAPSRRHLCAVAPSRRRLRAVAGSSSPGSWSRHRSCASSPHRRRAAAPARRCHAHLAHASSLGLRRRRPLSYHLSGLVVAASWSSLAPSSPSHRVPSCRCRRRHVVAATFPASSPPCRLVSAPSSFHRHVALRCAGLWHPSVHRGVPSSSPKSSSPPFGAPQRSTVVAAAVRHPP